MKVNRLLGTILSVVLASVTLFAQSYTGRILGTITDQSGAALAGATVTVTDIARGTTRTITTDQAGAYVAPNLLPGSYKVRAEAKGFKSVERPNIELEVAKDALIDLSLPAGNVSETVQVTDEIPLLDTTSSTLGGTLSNSQINDLPLNGRNYENLLQLRPGVTRYPGGGFSTTSTNGLRAEDNAYFVDGLFNSEPFSGQGIINGAGIAGDSATILPIDAIQEFNLQENAPAEYGWKPGAVVNVGIKSGTNNIHGTAFAFGRDGVLDARNYFNTVPNPKTPRNLEQWGGSFGGAIKKDKLFYFGSYEQQTYTVGNSFGGVASPATVSLPNAAGSCIFGGTGDCVNSIPDAIADLQAGGFPISPVSLQIAGCTLGPPVTCNGKGFPTNNGTNPNGPTAIVNGFPNDVTSRNVIGKMDYHYNDHHTISGLYFFGNNSGTVEDFPELQPAWLTLIHTRAQVVGGSWTWIPTSRWVNEVRFGYNRLYQPTFSKDNSNNASIYGLNTGVPFSQLTGGLPRIGWFGQFQALGGFKWPKLQGPDSITQFIDHVSYTAGKHAIKFGGEIHRNGVNGGAFGNARGSVNFGGGAAFTDPTGTIMSSAIEDFFAGDPTNGSILSGDPRRSLSNWGYALFVQDDWRATKTVTLNFGLRYELNTVVKEAHNLLANFDPNLGLLQVGQQISAPYDGNHKNFAPRGGFAWDVTGKGNTVLRGGAGLVYETVNSETFLAFNNSFGINSIPTGALGVGPGGTQGTGKITSGNISPPLSNAGWNSGPLFPTGLVDCNPTTASPCSILGIDRNIKTPYVTSWNFNLQHAFTPKVSLELAYVGNHGTNLINIRDINQQPAGGGARPFANKFDFLGNIFQEGNLYRSNYNALQATLTSRDYHGLGMVLGYTYGHSLDDVGANWDFGYGAGLPQDSFNLGREYANSDFDVRQRLTASITYDIPGKKGFAQLMEGWELNSIVTLETSQPWGTIDLGSGVSGSGSLAFSPPASGPDRWNFYGNPQDFKARPTPIPFFAGSGNPAAPTSNASCNAESLALDGGLPGGPATSSLATLGCYAQGSSFLIPPPFGQFGTSGRNIFPDAGFRNWDFSVAKKFHFGERVNAQFRAEFFNILNHPNFANPYGGQNGYGQNDPSVPGFGCSCATPDVAAANPVIGSGGSRAIQLGLKFIF
jgi:hypothetical protein